MEHHAEKYFYDHNCKRNIAKVVRRMPRLLLYFLNLAWVYWLTTIIHIHSCRCEEVEEMFSASSLCSMKATIRGGWNGHWVNQPVIILTTGSNGRHTITYTGYYEYNICRVYAEHYKLFKTDSVQENIYHCDYLFELYTLDSKIFMAMIYPRRIILYAHDN